MLAISPTDVWRFFSLRTSPSYTGDVTHFDGRRWTKVKVPVPIEGTSVVSSHDIWATSTTCTGVSCGRIVHWTGSTWSTSLQPPTTGNDEYYGSDYRGIVARSANDVWVLGNVNPKATPSAKDIFLHWDGKAWAMLPVPADNPQSTGLTDDGAGGFWASSIAPSRFLYHYHAGAWTRIAQPTKKGLMGRMNAIGRIPGTASLWGVGELDGSQSIYNLDAIFKFGP